MTSNKSVIEQNTSGIPRFVPLLIGLLIVSMVSLILLAKASSRNTQAGSFDFVQATQAFVPGQAMTITAENITIYVPQDAVSLPGTISVVSQQPNLFPAVDQPDWTRPRVIEVLFLNTQSTPVPNIIFSKPVQVCFTVSSQQWEDFTQRPDAYQVQYYAVENHPPAWQSLPTTSYDDLSMLCGETMHFSMFALAIRTDSGIPVTGLTATPTAAPPTAPGVRRTPIRTKGPPENTPVPPGATQPLPTSTEPPPTETQPPPTDVEPPPTNTPEPPPPTDPPPPADTETPPSGGILPLPTLPCLLLCP